MRRFLWCIFFLQIGLGVAWTGTALGQITPGSLSLIYELDSSKREYTDLNNYLQVLEDPDHKLTEEQVASPAWALQFRPYRAVGQLSANSTWWGKITIRNALPRDSEWILHVADRYLNYCEVYVERQTGQGNIGYEVHQTGLYTPLSRHDSLVRANPHEAKVGLFLYQNQTVVLYLKVRNTDHKKPVFKLRLASVHLWEQSIQARNLAQGIFQGILWMSLIYNLFVFLLIRDQASLNYGLHVLAQSVYMAGFYGILFEWTSIQGNVYPQLYILSTSLIHIFDLLFKRHFLDLPKNLPLWDKIITAALAFFVTEMVVMLVWNFATSDLASILVIHQLVQAVQSIFFLVLLIPFAKIKSNLLYYVFFGTLFIHLGVLYSLFANYFLGSSSAVVVQVTMMLETLTYFLGISFKIRNNETEKRKAQDELIKQLRANEVVTKELDSFLYRASHDMRRPLTSLLGLHEVAKLSVTDAEAMGLFDMVNTSAKSMDRMVNKYIMLHQVYDCGPETSEVKVGEMVRLIYEDYAETLQQFPHLHWVSDLGNAKVRTVPILLEVILRNLLENSIFFSQKDRNDALVKVSIARNGKLVTIKVTDNGIGIPKEFFARIFEMYFRGSEVATHGNGLGLYVVQKAAAKLGAKINLQSELDVLTEFELVIQEP
jgi:signal transduction histidine kinase